MFDNNLFKTIKKHYICIMDIISENLRKHRRRLGLTQSAIAKKVGISRARYSSYEMKIALPPIKVLVDLSELFNVLIDDLVGADSWVSVKNKLPDDSGNCAQIIRIYASIKKGGSINMDGVYKDGRFLVDGIDVTDHTTHWRPIPEPPKQ